MFKVNDEIIIKSSGNEGVVQIVDCKGGVVIKTSNGTYSYTKSNAKKYLAVNMASACKCNQCLTRETTVLRNVITGRTIQDMQDMVGPARAALEFQRRATGRTTGIAMALIGVAMQQAYQWHDTVDHFVGETQIASNAHSANLNMMKVVKGIISQLKMVGFEFQGDTSIRFVPIVKETTKYEPKTVITSFR